MSRLRLVRQPAYTNLARASSRPTCALCYRIDGSGVLVAEGVGPVNAHLDLHFRLMHHDLLAELIDATCSFKALGGIGMLEARQKRQVSSPASSTGASNPMLLMNHTAAHLPHG